MRSHDTVQYLAVEQFHCFDALSASPCHFKKGGTPYSQGTPLIHFRDVEKALFETKH